MDNKSSQQNPYQLITDVKRAYSEMEAAGFLNISVSGLRKSRMNGSREKHLPTIPYVRLGRRIMYLREDLECALLANRVEA
jgi:hypothetical protein